MSNSKGNGIVAIHCAVSNKLAVHVDPACIVTSVLVGTKPLHIDRLTSVCLIMHSQINMY